MSFITGDAVIVNENGRTWEGVIQHKDLSDEYEDSWFLVKANKRIEHGHSGGGAGPAGFYWWCRECEMELINEEVLT